MTSPNKVLSFPKRFDLERLISLSQPIGQAILQKLVDSEGDDNDSDNSSETPSIIYSHQTLETYKEKVELLLASLFSHDVASQAVLSRLQGGSYNRIIGVSIPTGSDPECCISEEFILRVPRFEAADVQTESSLLIASPQNASRPIPRSHSL